MPLTPPSTSVGAFLSSLSSTSTTYKLSVNFFTRYLSSFSSQLCGRPFRKSFFSPIHSCRLEEARRIWIWRSTVSSFPILESYKSSCTNISPFWRQSRPSFLMSGQKKIERLWREFFWDPSEWWDHRHEKTHAGYPDFKHKKTEQPLWIVGRLTPSWVKGKLDAMKPGRLQKSIFCWNAALSRFVKNAQNEDALQLYHQMAAVRVVSDKFTVMWIVKACCGLRAVEEGRRVHAEVVLRGWTSDIFIGSSLIAMYASCGRIEEACRVFNELSTPDLVCWSSMLVGYVKCGEATRAMELFRQMEHENVQPDSAIFAGLFIACASVGDVAEARHIHASLLDQIGHDQEDEFVESCLIDMYSKCGSLEDAVHAFNRKKKARSVVCWSAMMNAYLKRGEAEKALELYRQMREEEIEPDSVTFVEIVKACGSILALKDGRLLHQQIVEKAYESHVMVASSLLDMYAKCGSMQDAWRVFQNMPQRDVVSWSVMIAGYVKSGEGERAIELFVMMKEEKVVVDSISLMAVLNACSNVAALEEGRGIHKEVIEGGFGDDVPVMNCLIDMYAKCGSIEDACRVFNHMQSRDVVSWGCMLGGYAIHGMGREALHLFHKMNEAGATIDSTTFISLLSACSHAGLVDEGCCIFESIGPIFGSSMIVEHVGCMVDLLGRSHHLDEAKDLIKRMPYEPHVSMWISLLGSCRKYNYIKLGETVANQILKLDPENESCYALLSNIHVSQGVEDLGTLEKGIAVFL